MGIPLSQCPTCLSKQQIVDGVPQREPGTYFLDGKEYCCDCKEQIALRTQYLVAGIGDQYMRLGWDDYIRDGAIKEDVCDYVATWDNYRIHGIGIELWSKGLGSGKTLLVCCIGKELIKLGHKVFFVPFTDVITANTDTELSHLAKKMTETNLLILDELRAGSSEKQKMLYSDVLERIARERTNYNLPTIITTNLTPKELLREFPRTYSLLSAKQIRKELPGPDHRTSEKAFRDIFEAERGEIRPII